MFAQILLSPALASVQSKEPNLYMLGALLLLFLVVWFTTGISPKQRNRRVKLMVRYIRDKNEIHARIESVGKLPVEIMAPEMRFYNRTSNRVFVIKSPGRHIFPLVLFPKDDYEFRVELDRFYIQDKTLHGFRKVDLILRESSGRLLRCKKIWVK